MGTTPQTTSSLVASYISRISKASTNQEIQEIIMEAIAEPNDLINNDEDFDFIIAYSRYRRIKLGIITYTPGCIVSGFPT